MDDNNTRLLKKKVKVKEGKVAFKEVQIVRFGGEGGMNWRETHTQQKGFL